MATKIVTKNSSTASAVPTASDLVQGELAVNVADKRLFTEDNGGSIVELGTKPSTIDINAGSIDGTTIGASSASTGAFTTLTASGAFTSRGIDDNADATAITIDSSENVGIGTTSADEALEVSGDVKSSGGNFGIYHFGETSDVTKIVGRDASHGSFPNTMDFFTNSAQRMRIDSSGNVGIGTSSPDTLLNIASSSAPTIRIENTDTSLTANQTIGDIDFYQNDPSGGGVGVVGKIRSINSSSFQGEAGLAFHTGTTSGLAERARIDSSGNVGIGTSSPQTSLAVETSGTQNVVSPIVTGQTSGVTYGGLYTVRDGSGDQRGLDLKVYTANVGLNTAMRIDSSGNVGIGTSSPSKPLEITDATNDGTGGVKISSYLPTLEMDDISGGGTSFILQQDGANTLFKHDTTERMRIDSSGNLLVGSTSSNAIGIPSVEVGGSNGNGLITVRRNATSAASQIIFKNPNGSVGQIQTNGSSTSYVTSSDQRLKENIADADDAGSKIDAIQVRQYDWKADGSHQDYGMIAQELQTVAPEAVSGDADSEEMMGVDYSKLVPMLIKEIQSLRNRVAQLEE